MTRYWPLVTPLLGLGLFIAGFGYDMTFAGLPYQDPTPEMQARWQFHHDLASKIYLAGGVVFLFGLLALVFRLGRRVVGHLGSGLKRTGQGASDPR